jgi:hypothetical protein
MKVLVLGDSFADINCHRENAYPSWVELLKTKYNYDIDSKGVAAASLYHCYSLFKDLHSSYDKIIFVITFVGRLAVPENIPFGEKDHFRFTNGNIEVIKQNIKNIYLPLIAKKSLNAAIEYYKYLFDIEKEKLFHDMMLEDIKRERPDTIFINVEDDDNCVGLHTISENERKAADIDNIYYTIGRDRRVCHMLKRNNEILAEILNSCIKENKKYFIREQDFEVDPKETRKYFLTVADD